MNKVAIETGFPCVPTIYKIEGGGWGAFSRGALVRRYDLIGGYLFGGGFGAFYGVGAYLPSF